VKTKVFSSKKPVQVSERAFLFSFKYRKVVEVSDLPGFYFKAKVRQAIGDGKISGPQRKIVAGDLGKSGFGYFHIWRFALDQ